MNTQQPPNSFGSYREHRDSGGVIDLRDIYAKTGIVVCSADTVQPEFVTLLNNFDVRIKELFTYAQGIFDSVDKITNIRRDEIQEKQDPRDDSSFVNSLNTRLDHLLELENTLRKANQALKSLVG